MKINALQTIKKDDKQQKKDVIYRKVGSTSWAGTSTSVSEKTLTNLIPNTLYEFQLRVRGHNTLSSWSVSKTFRTYNSTGKSTEIVSKDILDKDTDLKDVLIYPNPTTGIVFINADSKILNLQLFSDSGMLIMSLNENLNQLSLDFLPTGKYNVKILTEKGEFNKVLIKK